MRGNRFLVLGAFLVLAAVLGAGVYMGMEDRGFTRKIPSPFIGKPVPTFDVPALLDPGKRVSPAQYKGKVWILNVFGSWCSGCWTEHEFLGQLAKRGVLIVGVNWRDERSAALDMLERAGNPYVDIAFDPDSNVAVDLGVYGAPESFIIDKRGVIRHKHTGIVTPQAWREDIQPLLAKLNAESGS